MEDDLDRPWLSVGMLGPYSVEGAVAGINGTATVHNVHGCVMSGQHVNITVQCVKNSTHMQ